MKSRWAKAGSIVLFGGIIIGLIAYTSGVFETGRIEPGEFKPPLVGFEPQQTGQATVEVLTDWFEAVGTVRPRTEIRIESRITGRVLEIMVRPGARVEKGQPLITLDARQPQAVLAQAVQGLEAAKAARKQAGQAITSARAELKRAEAEYVRIKRLFQTKATTTRQLEQAEAAFVQAQAGASQASEAQSSAQAQVRQAEKKVEEARVALSYTKIEAPDTGQVVRRQAEPGDMAWPGKPLLSLQTDQSLRLEALVPESLVALVGPGVKLTVAVDSLNRTMEGTVEELVPSADPETRTFLAKVAIRGGTDLYPGMFGRLRLPQDKRRAVVVEQNAVRRIGQLEVVRIKTDRGWRDQFVRTGQPVGDKIEILSGLDGNETVALEAEPS